MMKLTKIEIFHFGKLNNLSFDLNDHLNVFWGNNEAGKSTTVAFIKQVLFGFHLRTNKSAFFEDYFPLDNVSPMGGKLYFKDHENYYVLQRVYTKGDPKKGVLTVELNGSQVPDSIFFDQLKNIDGSFYTDSFIFNQDMLAEVNSLSQEELMERIYFLGASQSNKLLALRNKYDQSASKLFKKTGRKPIINQLLKQIDDQKNIIIQTNDQFENYQQLDQKEKELSQELASWQAKLKAINEKSQKLDLLKQKLINFRQYQDFQQKYNPVSLSKNDYQKAKDLVFEINSYQKNLDNLNKKIAYLQDEVSHFNSKNIKVQSLLDQRLDFLQWQSELKQMQKDYEQLSQEIAQLEELNPDLKIISNLSPEQIQNLKSDYQSFKKQNQKDRSFSDGNIKLVAGAIAILSIVLALVTKNMLWLGLLLVDGIGAYFIYQQINKKKEKISFYNQKYNLDFTELNLDSALQQFIQLDSKKHQLGQLQAEIAKLNNQISYFISQLSKFAQVDQIDSTQVSQLLSKLQLQLQTNQDNQRQLHQLKQQIQDINEDLLSKKEELNSIFLKNKVQDMKDFDKRAQKANEQEKLKLHLDALKNNLKDDLSQLEKLANNDDQLNLEEANIQSKSSASHDMINKIQDQLAQVKVTKNNLADSDELFNEKQKLANLQAQLEQESVEYLSDLLVSQWIGRSLDLASNERFPKMIKSAEEYFKLLTGDRYISLSFGKKLTVTNATKKKLEVQYLSRGTSEQLYFALKLAFVEQISDEISLPILIDDAFVNFDNQRIEYIIKLLKKLSEKTQVLIFTQRKELGNLLGEKVLAFNESENK